MGPMVQMVGLVVAIVAAVAAIVSAVYVVLAYYREPTVKSKGKLAPRPRYGLIVSFVFLAWVAVAFDYWDRHRLGAGLVQLPPLITHYGNLWEKGGGGCQGGINTSWLMNCRERYMVALACGIQDRLIDPLSDTRMSISAPFTITGGVIEIVIPYRQEMLSELSTKGADDITSLWFHVLLIPKDIDMTVIHRLSDIPKYGGKIADDNSFLSRLVNYTGCD